MNYILDAWLQMLKVKSHFTVDHYDLYQKKQYSCHIGGNDNSLLCRGRNNKPKQQLLWHLLCESSPTEPRSRILGHFKLETSEGSFKWVAKSVWFTWDPHWTMDINVFVAKKPFSVSMKRIHTNQDVSLEGCLSGDRSTDLPGFCPSIEQWSPTSVEVCEKMLVVRRKIWKLE